MMDNIKKFLKKLKPIKYITLLNNYNKLESDYNLLRDAIKEECFQVIYAQINVPEQIQKKDRRIKQLEKQNKLLKETIKIVEDEKNK